MTFKPNHIVKSAVNLDTARSTNYMTDREKDMIKEVNLIRSNPKGYIPAVKDYIIKQEAQMANVTMGADWIQDEINTAHELIAELEITPARSILMPYDKLQIAAKLHGDEGKAKGDLGHQGADGSWPWDRIKREDPALLNAGENLVGGPASVHDSVMILLIDSGIPGRGHRKNLLNPDWKYGACYEVGTVGDMPNYWVQNFAAPIEMTTATPTTTTTITTSSSDFGSFEGFGDFEGFEGFEKVEGFTEGTVTTNSGTPTPTTGFTVVEKKSPIAPAPTGDVSEADLDTARHLTYMTEREKDMIKEVNLIRSNPIGYIPVVEAYIQKQEAEKLSVISGADWIQDDIDTAKELIEELKTTPRLSILKPYEKIYTAAKLHGEEGKAKGDLEHQGSDGSWPWDRVLRQAPELSDGNENLVGGPSDVKTSVMLLLVDSGIPNRGHRKTTLNPSWTYAGFYEVGTVGDMPNYWVQKYGY
ncbi:MAG: CAP domain-containing protein [Saprospiraceae bacterium]